MDEGLRFLRLTMVRSQGNRFGFSAQHRIRSLAAIPRSGYALRNVDASYFMRISGDATVRFEMLRLLHYVKALTTTPCWLLLNYKVPPEPAAKRIVLWRRLKGMGKVCLQNGV